MTDSSNPMTGAPVNTMLLRMAAPISLGMLSTFLFQVVDTYFVGLLGSAELAALAFSSTVYLVVVSVFLGLSVGVSSVIARVAGEGRMEQAQGIAVVSLGAVLILSALLSLAGLTSMGPMFHALGANDDILPMVSAYMGILYVGFPFLMLGIVGSGAVRAIGITKETEIVFALAGVINLVFDWVLIFGHGPFPELGLAGAAYATVISFVFIFVGVVAIMFRHGLLGTGHIMNGLRSLADVLRFAVPTISM